MAPACPPHRWSRTPSSALGVDAVEAGTFIAEVGVGVVHAEHPDPTPRPRSPVIRALEQRIKARFDPSERLNPARQPGTPTRR